MYTCFTKSMGGISLLIFSLVVRYVIAAENVRIDGKSALAVAYASDERAGVGRGGWRQRSDKDVLKIVSGTILKKTVIIYSGGSRSVRNDGKTVQIDSVASRSVRTDEKTIQIDSEACKSIRTDGKTKYNLIMMLPEVSELTRKQYKLTLELP